MWRGKRELNLETALNSIAYTLRGDFLEIGGSAGPTLPRSYP